MGYHGNVVISIEMTRRQASDADKPKCGRVPFVQAFVPNAAPATRLSVWGDKLLVTWDDTMLTTVVRSPEAGPSQTTGNGKKGGGDLKVIDLQGTRWKA
jgi:hypothetical protein